ncbi:MAG TPA: major capsid protein [Roseiflexaceae bacterium]|nr:major capsid protein [Roseiflexaceae bacterium]
MNFSFEEALRKLGAAFAFLLINGARPASSYLFSTFLPERPMRSYEVKSGSMTIRPTMAGLVGMDSPLPPTGQMEISTFLERSAKIGNRITMTEEAIRTLQEMLMFLQASGASTNERMVEEVLNFTNALIIQPHLDTAEWMRGLALTTGAISWTFNGLTLSVDYGIPSGNKLAKRTGNNAYGGSTSKFWDDVRAQNRLLRSSRQIVRIAHSDLIDDIVYNTANNLQVLANDGSMVQVRKMISQNGTNAPSSDARDVVTIYKYDLEAEIIDPTDSSKTIKIPFCPRTQFVALGTAVNTGYVVGAGSTQPTEYELGYTHLAPTVEAGGAPGRWARVRTPENRPWQLEGEGASNLLPVIDARSANRIAIASSEVSS